MFLSVKNLTKTYLRSGRTFAAVNDLSFELERGDFVSLVGRSGNGKTTLVNMIAGLLTPDSGEVLFDGQSLFSLNDLERSIFRNQRIGYVAQGQGLLSNLSVLDNVRLPFHLHSRTGASLEKARSILDMLGLVHLEDSYPSSLSGGEMRRVALGRALINDPELLMADEPTGDLDLETARQIFELLLDLKKINMSILVVTHDPELAEISGRVLTLKNGSIESCVDN